MKQSSSDEQIASLPTVVRNDGNFELLEFKPDKIPVGKHDNDTESFRLQTVNLQKGDVIYTLTDGFPDQFGGDKGKKYMVKNLKELLLSIAHLPMLEQEKKLALEFEKWKGRLEQVDDVCIIGVRI
jgi:serine phosphatase RsbU (regulator of sigma subunit)